MKHYKFQDLGESIISESRHAVETELNRGGIETRLERLSSIVAALVINLDERSRQSIADDVAEFYCDEDEE